MTGYERSAFADLARLRAAAEEQAATAAEQAATLERLTPAAH